MLGTLQHLASQLSQQWFENVYGNDDDDDVSYLVS